jgi:hypothetical protein
MPMFRAFVNHLNRSFDEDRIGETAKSAAAFAPGKTLDASFVVRKGSTAHKLVQTYLNRMPHHLRESLRGAIHGALTSKPAKPITFAWAPGYDFEVNIWDYGCGMTVLVRGRYPKDRTPSRTDR